MPCVYVQVGSMKRAGGNGWRGKTAISKSNKKCKCGITKAFVSLLRDSSRICAPNKTVACRVNDPRETPVSGEKKNHSNTATMKKYAPQRLQESRTQAKIFNGAKECKTLVPVLF